MRIIPSQFYSHIVAREIDNLEYYQCIQQRCQDWKLKRGENRLVGDVGLPSVIILTRLCLFKSSN